MARARPASRARLAASEALRRLAAEHSAPRVTVSDLMTALGDHGFGLLILALALPNAVPGPTIPGFSAVFATGLVALGAQMAWGEATPRLPRWFLRCSVATSGFRRFAARVVPWLARGERLLRPRRSWLTGDAGTRLVGTLLIGFSLVLALPVPLGNVPVATAIAVVALGLMEGDGFGLAIGLAAGLAAVLWNGVVIFAGAAAWTWLEARFF